MRESSDNNDPPFRPRRLPLRALAPPPGGCAHLWFADLARLGSPLRPGRTHGGVRLTPAAARTARRFYLRLLLGAYLGLPGKDVSVLRTERGKPSLDPLRHDTPLQFSLAASGSHCLYGFATDGPLGIDLEPAGRRAGQPLALARRYFSATEAEALARLDAGELGPAFLRTWACKEAVVKAAGHGIANQLCRFTVETDPGREAALLDIDDDDPAAWRLRVCRPSGDFLAAIAARQERLDLKGFSLRPPAS